jgi:hypothetical protein
MKTFNIPCFFTVSAAMKVKANSLEEAEKMVWEGKVSLPEDELREFVNGSLELDVDHPDYGEVVDD